MTNHVPQTFGILIYDGDCGFCSTSATWLAGHAHLVTAPYQWTELTQYGLTTEEASKKVQYVDGNSVRFSGAPAIAAALQVCTHWSWRAVGRALTFPGISILAVLGYSAVARYRHLFPGGTPTCRMPRP